MNQTFWKIDKLFKLKKTFNECNQFKIKTITTRIFYFEIGDFEPKRIDNFRKLFLEKRKL